MGSGIHSARCRRVLTLATVFSFLVIPRPSFVRAEPLSDALPGLEITRVEEAWELRVGTPDSKVVAPQVTCVISPVGNADCVHAVFNLNHQTLPGFAPGGLQLQIWDGDDGLSDRSFTDLSTMSESGEIVRWTQSMTFENGLLTFEVLNGQSTTWGSFGGQGYLRSSISTYLSNLNNYDPFVSLDQSGVVFAANRVESLVLQSVRVHTSDGQSYTFNLNESVDLN